MPLPFLTADRAFETADDIALPFDDRDRWRRPYRPGPWRVGAAALWLLLASFVLFAAVIIAFTAPAPEAAVVFGIALAAIVVALRLLRVGAWVSTRGLRQVSFFGTRTTPGTGSSPCGRCSSRCAGSGCRGQCRVRRWSSYAMTARRRTRRCC